MCLTKDDHPVLNFPRILNENDISAMCLTKDYRPVLNFARILDENDISAMCSKSSSSKYHLFISKIL